MHALASLVVLYGCSNRTAQGLECLQALASRTALPGGSYLELAQLVSNCGAGDLADRVLQVAQQKGLSAGEIEQWRARLRR